MEKTERIRYIDIYKGFGILLMIMGHVKFGQRFDLYIHAFHMPMFFFISGFLFQYKDFKKLISRKFISLIVPYFIFGIFNLIMCILLIPNFKIIRYLEKMFMFNNYQCLDITGALWFLTCLFFANIIFFLIIKCFGDKWSLLICILSVGFIYFTKIKLPLSIDSAIYMLPVFYTGYQFKTISDKLANVKNKIDVVLGTFILVIFSFILFKNGYVNLRTNEYSNILMFYINAICMSIGIYYFSKFIKNIKISSVLEYCGKYSLYFLCLNQLIIFILKKINMVGNISILIATIFILVLINELVKYIKKLTYTY